MSDKYEVTIDNPAYEKGAELLVNGVGLVKNKGSVVAWIPDADRVEELKGSEGVRIKKVADDKEAVNEPPGAIAPIQEDGEPHAATTSTTPVEGGEG